VKDNFDQVRKIGLALPDVEESTMYGTPALKIRGKLIACIASHKSVEPGTLAVRISFDRRAELLETDPDVYYLKDHYVGYPCVLVRLSRIHPDALRDLLGMSWKFVSLSLRAAPRSGPRAKPGSPAAAKPRPRRTARASPRSRA
jgi:hypothetical protein